MANVVGTKGQVVIAKKIRDELGIRPGWLALQRLVDGHVEISFVMPEHNRSLKGALQKYIDPAVVESLKGLSWQEIRDKAWAESVKDWDRQG